MIGSRSSFYKYFLLPISYWLTIGVSLLYPSASSGETLYVIERERDSIALIENGKVVKEIKGLGNTNHALLKFYKGYGYAITRDGYLSKIDLVERMIIKRVKVGESTIGLDFSGSIVAVANYDPKDVVFLDLDLNLLKKVETGSKNVGIKAWGDLIIFSLMERDEIWVVNTTRDFVTERIFSDVGTMPFDALLKEGVYVAGFFSDSSIGLLDLNRMEYKRKSLSLKTKEITFKIPHFGTWGILGDRAYVPAVGERRLHIISLSGLRYEGSIELIGLPVFAVVSPDNKYIAVNYSGDREDYITIIDPLKGSVIKDIKAGRRILHMRFSKDAQRLYLSSYFEGSLKVMNTENWEITSEIEVPTPSGIFIQEGL